MNACYRAIDVDFPDRGYLLFWQLPLRDKLTYFEIEEQIAGLRSQSDMETRRDNLSEFLSFLGSDPVAKVNKAFEAKYKQPLLEYLELQK